MAVHLPPQDVSPGAQPHVPALHTPPWPQLVPQAPQFAGSELTLTHCPLHAEKPAGQAQVPALHVCPPPQALPHPPQFCGSLDSSTQLRPHSA
jgi:hypothetical protein